MYIFYYKHEIAARAYYLGLGDFKPTNSIIFFKLNDY
jgi:hypothetical protein